MRNHLKLFTACAATATALVGCGGGLVNGGNVRLVNATSAFATLDLLDGSTKISTGVATNTAGGYAEIDKGSHSFNIADDATGVTDATLSGSVSKDAHYTIVAYTTGGALATAFLSDDEGSPSSGTAKLRFFNSATTDVASIDAYIVATACSALASSFAAPIATSISGLQATYTQVNATGPGSTYHVCVTAAGDKTDLRLDIASVTLKDQQILTVILTPTAGGVLLNGLLLSQQSTLTSAANGSARIRLAVGTSGVQTVSASASGVTLGTGLTPPAVGNYKLVPANTALPVTVNGNTFPISAAPGADLTLLVTGDGSSTPVVIADGNSASTSTMNPVKIRLVNGMNGVSNAILTDDLNNVGDAATFGATSGYAQVAASSALARLEATSGITTLCLSTDVTLNSGSVYTVFVLGDIPSAASTCTIRVDR